MAFGAADQFPVLGKQIHILGIYEDLDRIAHGRLMNAVFESHPVISFSVP